MIRFGRLVLFVVAFGGFVCAHVLVQQGNAMEVPVPTVTVPTPSVPSLPVPTTTTPTVPSLPAPTVTVPTVPAPPPTTTAPPPVRLPPVVPSPAPTRPAPAPRSPQPATTTTLTVGAPAPARTRATPPSSGYGSTSPSGSTTPSTARTVGRTGGARLAARSRTFAATTHRTANRVSVRLAFLLPKAERRYLIVRGPAPSCRVVGYIPVRGRKGVNAVYFAGRVQGRRLEPGVYLISLSPTRRLVRGAATEYVRVVSPRRSLPLPDQARKPSCSTAAAPARDQASRSVLADAAAQEPTSPATGMAALGSKDAESNDRAAGLPDAGVLGVSTGDADEKPFLALAVLTLVGGLLIAMLILVTRFLRGSWNP